MMIVLALGMSRPDSMIVVQTRISVSPPAKPIITFSSWPSGIWPWPTAIRTPGSNWRNCSACASIVSTRLWTKKTWPPRSSSRRMASRTRPVEASATRVWIGSRSSGGVSMSERSRTPARARLSVRGIGVAESVSTSTSRRSFLSRSLAATPKRCSSSTMTIPRSRNRTSLLRSRCVPTTRSTEPAARPSIVASCSRAATYRDSSLTVTGYAANRWLNVTKCWAARTVVGTSTATCLPPWIALNMPRRATSVLP